MTSRLNQAVVKTLAYADVFDFPLKLPEIRKYLVNYTLPEKNWPELLLNTIKSVPLIKVKNGYYGFSPEGQNLALRLRKSKYSLKKINFARKISSLLFIIPGVKIVAVTGNLAMLSADENDDIDLLVVTGKNRIWLIRFLCVVLLKLLRVYRKPDSQSYSDKICLNMYIDENHLTLPPSERDLYSAHEIIQMKPVLFRPGYENILLRKNPWVKKFLPNTFIIPSDPTHHVIPSEVEGSSILQNRKHFSKSFDFLEICLKKLQLFYMKPRRTTEVIREGYLRFHPRDARFTILEAYRKKLEKYLPEIN